MRDRGDELHLLPGEFLRAACRQHEKADAGAEHRQDSGADEQIAPAHLPDGCLERAGRMFDDQPPVRRIRGDACRVRHRCLDQPLLGGAVLQQHRHRRFANGNPADGSPVSRRPHACRDERRQAFHL